MKTRTLGVAVAVVMLCSLLSACTVTRFALFSKPPGPTDPVSPQPEEVDEFPPSKESGEEYLSSDTWYFHSLLDPSQQAVYMGLYQNLQAYIEDDTDTEPFAYTFENPGPTLDGQNIVQFVGFDHPILAQYFSSCIVATENDGNMLFRDITTKDSQVFGDITDIRSQICEIEAAADAFLSAIDLSLSDYEKYLQIAVKLCREAEYDYAFGTQGQTLKDFLLDTSVYGGLVNHLCVCQGFAKTYQYVCQRAGLFCTVVAGRTSGGDHEWNIIKLDDGYYHVDVTWMQASGERYFCLTDDEIAVDHAIISQYHPECDGLKYAHGGALQ